MPNRFGAYLWIKAAFDRTIGLILFVTLLPVMAVAAVLVRRTSSGPALYWQVRVGRAGQTFWIYKLRTMYHNCEAGAGAKWCTKGDTRVTPLGHWLRRLHIDELPQLWNVMRGDMSLVGPRPERPEFVGPLDKIIPGYLGRLAVKPGVTGLAQIQRPADTDVESVRKKLVLDLCYVEEVSASLDLRIMIGTVLYLVGMPYAGVRRVMRLPSGPSDDMAMMDTVLE
jgi:lipopolysaccharide/colanic/teichoic acid biosynthesis glycosyltransferase